MDNKDKLISKLFWLSGFLRGSYDGLLIQYMGNSESFEKVQEIYDEKILECFELLDDVHNTRSS